MDVIIEEKIKNKYELELGDIIMHHNGFYLVLTIDGQFVAKNLNGNTGLFGLFSSLKRFNEKFNELQKSTFSNAVVFKASEYSLKLVKKDTPILF